MKIFYDHLTGLDSVRAELSQYLSPSEIEEIILILDEATHHIVMETILKELPLEEHDVFLERFANDPAANHLRYLQQFSPRIEEHIAQAAADSNRRFLDTIHS